jgi:AcrR family transcriptional regulator
MAGKTEAATAETPAERGPRKASPAVRREQLIEATIEVLAERGFSRTRTAEVAARAGVAYGLVNFHFRTKDMLLSETLTYLADEYRQNWTEALENAPPDDPARQLQALIEADFSPPVFTPARLAAWCAFWGEAQSRPMYQAQCGSNDRAYFLMLERVCAWLIDAGGYALNPTRAARILRVTMEGTWLDLITMTEPYSGEEAKTTIFTCAAALFPAHFTEHGLKAAGAGVDGAATLAVPGEQD